MYAKSKSPSRSRSPRKSATQYVNARAKNATEYPLKTHKQRKQHSEAQYDKPSKTAAIFMGVFFLMFITSAVYSFFRSKSAESEKPRRQQIAGLDIPREVIERMQKLRNAEDRERVLLEWAHSYGITFEDRRDGSYVAVRDGKEYILRYADPDFNPDVENAPEADSQLPDASDTEDAYEAEDFIEEPEDVLEQ